MQTAVFVQDASLVSRPKEETGPFLFLLFGPGNEAAATPALWAGKSPNLPEMAPILQLSTRQLTRRDIFCLNLTGGDNFFCLQMVTFCSFGRVPGPSFLIR